MLNIALGSRNGQSYDVYFYSPIIGRGFAPFANSSLSLFICMLQANGKTHLSANECLENFMPKKAMQELVVVISSLQTIHSL